MTQKATFVGGHVEDVRRILTVSALTGLNAQLIGKPGTGKTQMCRAAAIAMFHSEWVFVTCTPTMSDEPLIGFPNPAKLLADPPEWEYVVEGTARDPDAKCVILDEFPRATSSVLEVTIHEMENTQVEYLRRKVFWTTANFVPRDERLDAVFDRIGLSMFMPEVSPPIELLSRQWSLASNSDLVFPGDGFPTQKEIDEVRSMQAGDSATDAVAKFLKMFVGEINNGLVSDDGQVARAFPHTPRRERVWHTVLSRVSMWRYGTPEFSQVHEDAVDALKFAWVSRTPDEARDWETLVGATTDPVQALIDNVYAMAYRELQTTAENTSAGDRMTASLRMGEYVRRTVRPALESHGIPMDDPRIEEMERKLNTAILNFNRIGRLDSQATGEEAITDVPF